MIDLSSISSIAFGCDPLGGHNWGIVDPSGIAAAVPVAIDKGVTLFDTADAYGNGLSEERLGMALGRRRNEVLIASKFGVRINSDGSTYIDNNPAWIRAAVEASLRRLGTDVIDIYQLHWWDKRTPFAAIFETLEGLVRAGKIRGYGSTNVTLEMMGISNPAELPPNFVSTSMEFSLVHSINRTEIQKMCSTERHPPVSFFSWGSLGGGILTGKYTSASDLEPRDRRLKRAESHFTGPQLARNLALVGLCRDIAAAHGPTVTTAQVALQWISRTLGFGTCLVGIKSVSQLEDAVASFEFRLSDGDVHRLDEAAATPC